jgi:hypothetical protein
MGAIKRPSGAALVKGIRTLFQHHSDRDWRHYVDGLVRKLAKSQSSEVLGELFRASKEKRVVTSGLPIGRGKPLARSRKQPNRPEGFAVLELRSVAVPQLPRGPP